VIQSGTWLVGPQVASGTYQANAASGCYWERLRDFTGSFSAIIANNFVSSAGSQVVSITAGDAGFTANSSCGTWTRISSQSIQGQILTDMTISRPEQASAGMKDYWLKKRSSRQTPLSDR